MLKRRPWQEELEIIDRTMKAISGVTDPEKLVEVYWNGIGKLITMGHYVAISRRNVQPPFYLVTRSSRFTEHPNPWTQRELLPMLSGGILGEIAYANRPMLIENLPDRLSEDDPGRFYLEGFQQAVALPQYDDGEGINVTLMLVPPGVEIEHAMIPMLHWQSGLFGRGTQNLVLRNQLADALDSLNRELEVVGAIQRSLLPTTLPDIRGFELAADYRTSARAGGDYYDFFALDDGSVGIFIADVAGHGTPAAVLMAITHAIAHAHPSKLTPPGMLLNYLNQRLARAYTRGGAFVTAFYAVLDSSGRKLTYARAGHNPPRLARDGRILSLEGQGGLPLGILEEKDYGQSTIVLEPGDLLLLYTDGITEAAAPTIAGKERELFGLERLDALLLECPVHTPAQCISLIQESVASFSGNAPPTDDQTLLAIRCVR
jgi:sigma-B regulation protein RsbU (phosphoserine phosphatase)